MHKFCPPIEHNFRLFSWDITYQLFESPLFKQKNNTLLGVIFLEERVGYSRFQRLDCSPTKALRLWYPSRTFLLKTILNRFLYAKTLSGFESPLFKQKNNTLLGVIFLEERVGFEPTDARTSPVFKTGSFNRSDISP